MTTTTFRYHTERIDGEEREKPVPKKLHARIQQRLSELLPEGVKSSGAEILPELNVLCGPDRLVPDLTVAPRDAEYVDGDLPAANALLCIEIMSPGQTLSDLFDKCERLLSGGVPSCWVIWGEKRRVWLYTEDNPRETEMLTAAGLSGIITTEQIFQGVAE